ncbi:MAG: sulfatase-like hydrolase/transferase [Gemmatimonadetes bacterium]|nr:sulfatase-like hydrolase/transferase [Gemmatimonadota bacterium]
MNLLLISVDSLRLDFSPGVSAAVRTPRFSDLTRDFHLCQHCFSVSSATRPVHTSLFTGLHPFEHGIEGQHSPAMRQGVADLFDLCRRAGYAVGAFSEAPDIFTGLSYADHIAPLPPDEQLAGWLQRREPTVLFIHYWSVHPPNGAADGLAFGEVGQLLADGRIDLVQTRYRAAIEQLFERRIARLLTNLNLSAWTVFIISDHGQSWRADEPYHGQTLCNDVLRVPLYYRLPSEELVGRGLISLVDLFPTFLSLLELDHPYNGFARDIRSPFPPEYYLAEIDPGPAAQQGRQWSLFNASAKFTCDQATQRETLVETFSERPLAALNTRPYHQAYAALRAASSYVQAEFAPAADRTILEQRLRALGYLE